MGNLFECNVSSGKDKIIEIPLIQAAQTRRSDADNSKAIMILYNETGFLSLKTAISVTCSGVLNGASVGIYVGDSVNNLAAVFYEAYERNQKFSNKNVECNLLNKKYVKIVAYYMNQDGGESDSYGTFLRDTIIYKR